MKKRMITLILTVVMVLSVVACGDTKQQENSTANKEGVYDVVELETIATQLDSKDYNINQMKAIGDTLYMIAETYVKNGYKVFYMTCDMDGNIKYQKTIHRDTGGISPRDFSWPAQTLYILQNPSDTMVSASQRVWKSPKLHSVLLKRR